jgi:putative transposase
MSKNLVRYQQTGDLHCLPFSCHDRRPYLGSAAARDTFEQSLESMRIRHAFFVHGYAVMPEHVHLLLSEPRVVSLATALQAMKLSVAFHRPERPFWQKRYYDFNVYSERKRVEKLGYMHRNPVARGLVREPGEWAWSSYRQTVMGEAGRVKVESWWTRTVGSEPKPTSQNRDVGHPHSFDVGGM